MVKLYEIKDIVTRVAIIVAIVLVLFLIFAEAGLKAEPMVDKMYDVIKYRIEDERYAVDYMDENGEIKTVLCDTVVEGIDESLIISSREYWGFTESEATLIVESY